MTRDQEVDRVVRDTRRIVRRAVASQDIQLMRFCAEVLAETCTILFASGSIDLEQD